MARLILIAILFTAGSAVVGQPLDVFPNPFDGKKDETITLRNAGSEPITLDSLRFESSYSGEFGVGWVIEYAAYIGEDELTGYVVCQPWPWTPCEGGHPSLFGQELAPADIVIFTSILTFCAICRTFGVEDNLLIYVGGHLDPLEVEIVNGQAMVSVEDDAPATIARFQAFPNPARGAITLELTVRLASDISIRLVDATGRVVVNRTAEPFAAGDHQLRIDTSGLAAGVYHIDVRSSRTDGEARSTRRVVILR